MLRDEPYRAAFEAAAQVTLARIRRDRSRAPGPLKRVFTVLARQLFHPTLNAAAAWKAAQVRDGDLKVAFKDATGTSLHRYIATARIEVADILLRTTDLRLTDISLELGYTYHPTFTENYKRVKGKRPSEVARDRLSPPQEADVTALMASRGLLDENATVRHIQDLLHLCPAAAQRVRVDAGAPESEPRLLIDGARNDRLQAEGLWQMVRELPFEKQCRQVRRYLFASPVFFDLLRERSRQEGRKSRQRGVEVAELALVSLEGSERIFGDRIHDLRALGWAWLGNAHRLALDFSAAATAFEQADREWGEPRAERDEVTLAHICNLRGTLRMMRREYVEATQDLDRSCSLFRQSSQTRDEALALVQRARIHIYACKLSDAVADLQEAGALIDENKERELAFAIRGNLANAFARAGKPGRAAKHLEKARLLNRGIEDPLGAPKLDWIAGLISESLGDLETAKRLYQGVRQVFLETGESIYLGQVSVDLMVVHSMLSERERVAVLASETLPVLSSMRLYSETVAAVSLLSEAVEPAGSSLRLLNNLRLALQEDPLAEARAG